MLNEFANGFTLEEFILRVAEPFNMAVSSAHGRGIPTDAAHLDFCKRAVNDGYRRVQRSYAYWQALRPFVSITIGGVNNPDEIAPGRYRLPRYCRSAPIGGWVPLDDKIDLCRIEHREYGWLRRMIEQYDDTGTPAYASIGYADGAIERGNVTPELIVYPTPEQQYRIGAEFIVQNDVLLDIGDRTVMGAECDTVIVAAARYEAAQIDADADPGTIERYRQEFERELARAVDFEKKKSPPQRGKWTDPSTRRAPRVRARTGRNGDVIRVDGNVID